jgi:hypothetical protein
VPGVDREQQMWTYRYAESPPAPATLRPLTKRAEPPMVLDVLASVVSEKKVEIQWQPLLEDPKSRAVGFHVERAPVEVFSEDQLQRLRKDTDPLPEPSVGGIQSIGAFVRLTEQPVRDPRFTDSDVDLSKPVAVEGTPLLRHRFSKEQLHAEGKPYRLAVYAYRVRAVNAGGVESGPSPYALTIPSAPQWLYSKEAGNDCLLKWAKNPEQGIRGYRVYRMESPRINGPGQKVTRVTSEPLTEPAFTDKGIGKESRRYWVVAVDALGQEGVPSAPTWHYRLYRSNYEPFVGEWHQ